MATRKQRARRAKTFRHDYGFVVADEEGNEVEVSGADVRAKGKNDGGAAGSPKAGSKAPPKRASATREPPAPSWNRALKRGLPWGLAAGLGLSLISHTSIVVGVVYAAAFVPLMYWTDTFMYRRFQRRKEGGPSGKTR